MTLAPSASVIVSSTASSPLTMTFAAADASLWMRIMRPQTTTTFDVSGHYGRAIFVSSTQTPPQDIASRARARMDFIATPRVNLVLSSDGFISSRIGLRASDELVLRDPFLANRVLDGWSTQASVFARASPISSLRFDVRYAQMGAIAADVPSAVGIDTHAVTATAAASMQVTRRVLAGPVVRLGFTHFNHALLDVNFTRGSADVTTASVLGFARIDMTPRLRVSLTAGATLASAPPGVKDIKTIASPDVRLECRSIGKRVGAMVALSFGYQSVGPRIGFGTDYSALVDVWVRPFRGAARRDVYVHGIARMRAARTLLSSSAGENAPGHVSTRAGALGIAMSQVHALGWSSTAGVDMEIVSARVEPEPLRGDPPVSFRVLFSVGLVASTSTDRGRRLARDPLLQVQDERAAAPSHTPRRVDPAQVEDADSFDDARD